MPGAKSFFSVFLPQILFYWKSHKIWILNNHEICLIRHWLNDRSKLPNWRRFVKFLSLAVSVALSLTLSALLSLSKFSSCFFFFTGALSLSLINFIVANFLFFFSCALWINLYWEVYRVFRDSFYFDPDAFYIIDYFICIPRLAISD